MSQRFPDPTEEQIARMRAAVAKRPGGRIVGIKLQILGEPVAFVLRAHDLASFDQYFDEQLASPDDAAVNALARHVLWPYEASLDAAFRACPSLPRLVMRALTQHAGGGSATSAGARIDPLTTTTPDGVLASARLDASKAAELVAAADANGVGLSLIVSFAKGGGALVVRAPQYDEMQRLRRATSKEQAVGQAYRLLATDACAWSSEPLQGLFARLPALATIVVAAELMRLGGAGEEHSYFLGDGDAAGAAG